MKITKTWPLLAAVALVAACGGDGSEAGKNAVPASSSIDDVAQGDEHILSVADGIDSTLDDETVIELGEKTCDFLDESGGDFDRLDLLVGRSSENPSTVVELGVIALAGVPAYCPEWTDEMLAWGETSGEGL